MIYLVSKQQSLFSTRFYQNISFSKALDILNPLQFVQFDTETMGLDPHTKELLTVQLGNKDNQVVFDWTTLEDSDKLQLKAYFESDRVFIGWNLSFDLLFMYKQDIWPINLWDGMIAEKLIYLGYPPVLTVNQYYDLNLPGYEPVYDDKNNIKHYELHYSLKAAAKRHCNIDVDKTVRGKIVDQGLTEQVIVYAAGDVMWLEDIKEKQDLELDKQNLQAAMKFECEFIKSLAYSKFCGVKLDINKWEEKMSKDKTRLDNAISELNKWLVNWDKDRKYSYIERQGDLFTGFDLTPRCKINWSSQNQVIPFFEDLGIKVKTFDKKTKKEKKSIEEKILAPQVNDFPIIKLFLDYQGAAKVVSTYGDNYLKAVNPVTKRIHPELRSIGTDTCRIASGGGVYKINILNLPRNAETRACFVAEEGNVWISADYTGQESAITASTANDSKMIEILSSGGDLHSEVARSAWPDILGGLTDSEIKKKHKDMRQNAKGIEFGVFYGGDAHTLSANKGFEMKEAERIYNSFMLAFPGIKSYQDYCRKEVMDKGYILLNPVTKHRMHIHDYPFLKRIQDNFKDREWADYYWSIRKTDPYCDTVKNVKKYNQRKSSIERQSINYRIQNRGACAFKLAMIKLFNWIKTNDYLNVVKICVTPYDEINLECPKEIKDQVADILIKCMVAGGKPFCPRVYLGADAEIDTHWVH